MFVLFALATACEVWGSAGVARLDDPSPVVLPRAPETLPGPEAFEQPVLAPQRYVDDLVAGATHACARLYDGTVYCWGSNAFGQLGVARETTPGRPVCAGGRTLARRVFVGPTQTAIVTQDGQVGHWGLYAPRGDDGVVSWSVRDARGVGELVGMVFGDRSALAWDARGVVLGWGAPDGVSFTSGFVLKPVRVYLGLPAGQTLEHAALWSRAGKSHGCLVATGALWCWGANEYGQLGHPVETLGIFVRPLTEEVDRAAVGERHGCALTRDRGVWCWGANHVGQLGDGTTHSRDVPAQVELPGEALALSSGDRHVCALLRAGSVWCWGVNDHGQLGSAQDELFAMRPVRVNDLPKATDVTCGDGFSCARTEAGEAYCWGRNDEGQLGDGTTTSRWRPRQVRW